jgi:ABC-2 type transport system ATP-binding protein
MDGPMVVADDLGKRYGPTTALDGLDLSVDGGTVHGLLGPNGAGKTTAVRVFATLTRPDRGRARVAGFEVTRDPDQVRHRIGLAGQHAALDEKLTGRDNLRMFGRLYHLTERASRRRADELLDRFDLAGAAGRMVQTYSGGMRRRLDLVASLIVAPPVLFLDEPTTGLDPRSRNEIWATIRELARAGTTVVLTTQYLDEADQLADQVTVVDQGRAVASGTPQRLKDRIGSRLDVVVGDPARLSDAAGVLDRITGGTAEVVPDDRRISVAVGDGRVALTAIVRELDRAGVPVDDIALRRPTLDEVFLRLTDKGRPAAAATGRATGGGVR